MADTKRLKIIQHLIATAEAIESIKSVGYGSFEVLQKPRPALGILPDDEITERYPDDIYSERAGFACRLAVDEAGDHAGLDLERIIGDLHAALLADPTSGGRFQNHRAISNEGKGRHITRRIYGRSHPKCF